MAGKKRKCVLFDLDAHMTTDSKTPTIEDVTCASMSFLQSLMIRGYDVHSYSKHVKFLMDKSKYYVGAALIKYDIAAREKAELHGMGSFCYGDHEIFHTFLGLEHLKPKPKEETKSKDDFRKSLKNCCLRGDVKTQAWSFLL